MSRTKMVRHSCLTMFAICLQGCGLRKRFRTCSLIGLFYVRQVCQIGFRDSSGAVRGGRACTKLSPNQWPATSQYVCGFRRFALRRPDHVRAEWRISEVDPIVWTKNRQSLDGGAG